MHGVSLGRMFYIWRTRSPALVKERERERGHRSGHVGCAFKRRRANLLPPPPPSLPPQGATPQTLQAPTFRIAGCPPSNNKGASLFFESHAPHASCTVLLVCFRDMCKSCLCVNRRDQSGLKLFARFCDSPPLLFLCHPVLPLLRARPRLQPSHSLLVLATLIVVTPQPQHRLPTAQAIGVSSSPYPRPTHGPSLRARK